MKQLLSIAALLSLASGLYAVSLLSPTGSQQAGGSLAQTTLTNLVADFAAIGVVLGPATGAPTGTGAVVLGTAPTIASATLTSPVATGNTLTSAALDPQTIQYASIPLTLAQLQGNYTTPVVLVAAQGTGTLIEIQSLTLDLIHGSAAFSGGGAVAAYYGSASGALASATIAATVFTTFTASQAILVQGALAVTATGSGLLNTAVVLTNPTAVFTSGTAATGIVQVAYRVHNGLS